AVWLGRPHRPTVGRRDGQGNPRLRGSQGRRYSVAFSPDGARVLTGSKDATARLWDAATGKEIRAFEGHKGAVYSVAFSPHRTRVLTVSKAGGARLWGAVTGKEIR